MTPSQFWAGRAIPPYHDPTVPLDEAALRREVISIDAWLPDKFSAMVDRSARFTELFPGVRVEITTWWQQRLACDSGFCRPKPDSTTRPPASRPAPPLPRPEPVQLRPKEAQQREGAGAEQPRAAAREPQPTYQHIRGCGVIWVTLVDPARVTSRVNPDPRCGAMRLKIIAAVRVGAQFTEAGRRLGEFGLTLEVVAANTGPPLRLPARLFLDPDSLGTFSWDTLAVGPRSGVSPEYWANADGIRYEFGEAFDSYRHRMWRLVRAPSDTIRGGILETAATTASRTLRFAVSGGADSLRIPYRIQAVTPAGPLPDSIPPFDASRHLAGNGIVRDARLLTLPFYDGVAVIRFHRRSNGLARQILLDRLEARVVASLPGSARERDYVVQLGKAWRDSIRRVTPIHKLDHQLDRFGLLVASDTPFVTTESSRHPSDTTLIDGHNPCAIESERRIVRRRLALVALQDPTPAERELVARVVGGRWHLAKEPALFERLEVVGTFDEVDRKLHMLLRLPQVSTAILSFNMDCRPE
jgi:hypothetical protein